MSSLHLKGALSSLHLKGALSSLHLKGALSSLHLKGVANFLVEIWRGNCKYIYFKVRNEWINEYKYEGRNAQMLAKMNKKMNEWMKEMKDDIKDGRNEGWIKAFKDEWMNLVQLSSGLCPGTSWLENIDKGQIGQTRQYISQSIS